MTTDLPIVQKQPADWPRHPLSRFFTATGQLDTPRPAGTLLLRCSQPGRQLKDVAPVWSVQPAPLDGEIAKASPGEAHVLLLPTGIENLPDHEPAYLTRWLNDSRWERQFLQHVEHATRFQLGPTTPLIVRALGQVTIAVPPLAHQQRAVRLEEGILDSFRDLVRLQRQAVDTLEKLAASVSSEQLAGLAGPDEVKEWLRTTAAAMNVGQTVPATPVAEGESAPVPARRSAP